MISLILLSHSFKIVDGIKDLLSQMVKDVNIYAIGGTADGDIGSDYTSMKNATYDSLKLGEAIVLFDLGSTIMTMETIIDELLDEEKEKIKIVDAAFVEGAIEAAVAIEIGESIDNIVKKLRSLKLGKIQ